MNFPLRGEIYWVNLDPTIGTEIAKTRPGLVISNDLGNEYSSRVIVAPLTTQRTERVHPFEVLVPPGESGLERASKALIHQIRTVDKRRLGRRIGVLPADRMPHVDRAIRVTLAV